MVLLVVAPARLVEVVVGKTSDVVGAWVVVVVVEPPPPVVEVVGDVGVVVVELPGIVVGVVVVEPPGIVVGGVVVVEPPGSVVELGPVVPAPVVVVVTPEPAHVHALQRSPHGPRPASHASPASGSQIPSPQELSEARNGRTMPAVLAVNVAAIAWHPSVIEPTSVALPVIEGHDFHFARILVPAREARTLALAASHPLRTDTMRSVMSTTSDPPSRPGMIAAPETR
jgi:hypothetical protein